MTKRISQANTVVVPAVHADTVDGKVVAANTVVVPAEAEVASAKAEAKSDEAPVTVVADTVAALVAPAPMAMVAEPVAAAEPAATSASSTQADGGDSKDMTPYIVGGVLLAGGILAVALSSGGSSPTPTPTPAPTNTVTISSAATATVAENTAITATILDVNATAATTGGTPTYALSGTDAALFNIDAATGIITLKASPDFETKATYSITVTASSAASGTTPAATATQAITVTVTNVNEVPTITSAATATIAENSAITTVVYTATATDPDAGSVQTYSIGGTDAAAFNINATTGVVTFKASPDFETKSSYTFTVTATDNGTPALASAARTVTVTVTDLNEAPTFATATQAVNFAENGTGTVLTAAATDVDAGATRTYTLTGTDAALFNVSATGAVTFKAAPNFEAVPTKTSYSFNVVATDQGGLTATQAETVTLTNVNEAPTVSVPTAPILFLENTPATTVVFTATAADPDAGATFTYSLAGADAALFNVSATGAVTFKASPNFEVTPTKTSYSVSVVVTDQGGLTATSTPVVINIGDVNEAPVFASATATANVAENVATTATVFTAAATDVDSNTTVSYTISGADAALFNINATTGAVTFKASPNFEATPTKTSYNFTVTATDSDVPSLSATQAVTLNLTNVNETPTFAAATQAVNFAENGTGTVLTATATDPDGTAAPNTLSYSLTGADAALFNVSATGAVTFKAAPDFEATPTKTTFNFNVVATDQGGLTATQAETVTLTNVNEAPVFASPTAVVAIAENVGPNAIIGAVAVATDPEGNPITYTLTGADAASFTLGTNGNVLLNQPADFETKAVYTFNVVATDSLGLSATRAVTLNITDVVNEGVRIDGGTIPSGTNTNFSAAVGNVTFLESASAGNITTISAFTTGDIIQTDVATSAYSFSSVGNDLVISLLSGGVNSQITLTGAAGGAFIFNEASAEQAVGFDFFRSSIAAPPAATGNIDGAGAVANYNAGTAANTYTDSAAAPNVTTITNFSADDRIVATGTTAANPYSFSSVGNDLVISFLANGVSSQITLSGVANSNVFVFDEASAEQAVGFDFFRYG